jgi:excisionase family DNA binding protein
MSEPIEFKPLAVSLNDAAKITGLGRNRIYAEMKAGRLRSRKSGKRRLFLVKDLEAFLESLPPE